MADSCGGSARPVRLAPRRRRIVLVALALVLLVAYPSLADTPETGADPTVALTVTPSDGLSDGQTVTVTGTGFPPNTAGTIRQCGGTVAVPQCDLTVIVPFVTTATGDLPPTPVTVKRIITTGATTFNCGVQACALVATAGGRGSQHHIRMAGAGTSIPPPTATSVPPTIVPPPTTVVPPTLVPPTTFPPMPPPAPVPPGPISLCGILRAIIEPFPFLQELLGTVLASLGCAAPA